MHAVCVCSSMPFRFDGNRRESLASPRWLTSSAAKVSVNQVFGNIIDHIAKDFTEGLNSLDPLWKKGRIFLDILSNVEYYPAARACADLMGHKADHPYSVHPVPRRKSTKGRQKGNWIFNPVYAVDICRLYVSLNKFISWQRTASLDQWYRCS